VRARTVTGADGAFAFEAVPPGEWRYRVDGRVPTSWSPPFVVEDGRSVSHRFEIESGAFKD
jgi:protocatechuate 3,4-dioxygenase beta subunit